MNDQAGLENPEEPEDSDELHEYLLKEWTFGDGDKIIRARMGLALFLFFLSITNIRPWLVSWQQPDSLDIFLSLLSILIIPWTRLRPLFINTTLPVLIIHGIIALVFMIGALPYREFYFACLPLVFVSASAWMMIHALQKMPTTRFILFIASILPLFYSFSWIIPVFWLLIRFSNETRPVIKLWLPVTISTLGIISLVYFPISVRHYDSNKPLSIHDSVPIFYTWWSQPWEDREWQIRFESEELVKFTDPRPMLEETIIAWLARTPDDELALVHFARFHTQTKNPEEAITFVREAYWRRPDSDILAIRIMRLLDSLEQREEALTFLQDHASRNPDADGLIERRIGHLQVLLEDSDDAEN